MAASIGIICIVNQWEGFVKASGFPPVETSEILEEFRAPSYWRTASSSDPQFLSMVEAEIIALRSAMHRRNISDTRKRIIRVVVVIKSVLGKQ